MELRWRGRQRRLTKIELNFSSSESSVQRGRCWWWWWCECGWDRVGCLRDAATSSTGREERSTGSRRSKVLLATVERVEAVVDARVETDEDDERREKESIASE
jgi:hypothetical protein